MKMDKARNIQIMGIVNLTDDSYFAPSRCLGPDGMPDIGRTVGMARNLSEKRRNGGGLNRYSRP